MKRCPGCGTILKGDSSRCGVCGADLWQVQDEPLEAVVHEEQGLEAEADHRLSRSELASARRMMMGRLAVYVVTALMIVLGFTLVSTRKPSGLASFTPFALGFWLI